jgi:hypothetical protein
MKKLICLLLFVPCIVFAEHYMVYNYTKDVRIVLAQGSCLVNNLKGLRASIQRTDGIFIRGCWYFVDNNKHVRIDWDNPKVPGDFAVIDAKLFQPSTE